MSGKKKADLEETDGEVAMVSDLSPEVEEIAQLYKEVAEATADATLVPTSEDVRAMALTIFIQKHKGDSFSGAGFTPRTASSVAPSNKGAAEDVNEKRACAGPTCGGKTLVGRMGSNGRPNWYCAVCGGYTNRNSKTGETYFRPSGRGATSKSGQ